MPDLRSGLRAALSLVVAASLASCGGGGGGAASVETSSPVFAAESSESPPVGARVDLLAAGYMPFTDGAIWTYAVADASGNAAGTSRATLSNTAAVGGNRLLRFTRQEGESTETAEYSWRSDGLYASLADVGAPPGALAAIGDLREYAFPSYAAGETRVVVRVGAWDADLDGDGRDESFRLEYSQRFEGVVPLALPWDASASAARITSSMRLVIQPSATARTVGLRSSQEEYFAAGVGLVRSTSSTESLDGVVVEARRTHSIQTADIGGVRFAAPAPPAPLAVALPHAELVFDATRNVYYASVLATAGTGANTIATVVPGTGAVTYSAPLGGEPGVLAPSPDGSFLYVGLRAPGQIVKLALPSMTEVSRLTIGAEPFYGTLYAQSIAVSPADPNVYALSLAAPTTSPRHRGAALVNGTTMLPTRTQVHTGSNLLVFADASTVYGYNTESTEFGLRRIGVVATGLVQGTVVTGPQRFGINRMRYSAGQLYLANQSWRASDLTSAGVFASQSPFCVPLTNGLKALCAPATSAPQLTIWSATAYTQQATVTLPSTGVDTVRNLVPGAAGTAAVSLGGDNGNTRIWLLQDAAL